MANGLKMRGSSHQHADNDAQKNTSSKKTSHDPSENWRQVFKGTIFDLQHGSYVPNFIIGSIVALCSIPLAFMFNTKKGAIICGAIGLTLLIWLIAIAALRRIAASKISDAATDKISVRASTLVVGSGRPKNGTVLSVFWMAYNPDFLCPVSVSMYIRLTSHLPKPLVIDSLGVQGLTDDGWKKLVRIDSISGSLFSVNNGDFEHAVGFNLNEDAFDRTVKDKNIPPEETRGGWMFIELSEPYDSFKEFRLRMLSLDGSEAVARIDMPKPGSDSLLGAVLPVIPGQADLTSRRKMPFSGTPMYSP